MSHEGIVARVAARRAASADSGAGGFFAARSRTALPSFTQAPTVTCRDNRRQTQRKYCVSATGKADAHPTHSVRALPVGQVKVIDLSHTCLIALFICTVAGTLFAEAGDQYFTTARTCTWKEANCSGVSRHLAACNPRSQVHMTHMQAISNLVSILACNVDSQASVDSV